MRRILATVSASVVVALFAAAPGTAGPGFNNKYSSTDVEVTCTDGDGNAVGTVTYTGPLKMWPPNHKYQPTAIEAVAADADDEVTLATSGTHDEYATDGSELNGAGNTANDVSPASDSDSGTGSAATAHDLRSERAGTGDGRVYTLDWDATFTDEDGDSGYGVVYCGSADLDADGEPAEVDRDDAFQVTVPHDMRGGAGWKK